MHSVGYNKFMLNLIFFLNVSPYKVKGMCIECAYYIQSGTTLRGICINTDDEKVKTR